MVSVRVSELQAFPGDGTPASDRAPRGATERCDSIAVRGRLVEAAMEEAQGRGAHRLSLRVLGANTSARLLHEACGFVVECILRAEFLLDGHYIDDVLMDRQLAPEQ